ncbi:MAG: dTMP kinase [Spirochaetaceae bacterium]|jgi:dTMP kinase|nr:dTMP kinase [Spirochaetaceae bacterium]
MVLKNFVVFEGCDGSGTTTQRRILEEKLIEYQKERPLFRFHTTCEPTDGPAGALLRQILLKRLEAAPETRAYLFSADRNEHLFGKDGIAGRCSNGELVICDRYTLSSLVYQGIECGIELPKTLNSRFPVPELLLFFDIEPEAALSRAAARGKPELYDRLEFQTKVRERYHALLASCSEAGAEVAVIDAAASVEKVASDVWSAVEKLPIFNQ